MSHFWPFYFLIRPSLNHIHLCSFCYPDKWCVLFPVFSNRREQPSAADLLCSAHRTGSSRLHQHHLSMSVCEEKKNLQYFPIFTPNYYNPSLTFSSVLKDTLLLIEKQSGAIGAHKHFSSSMWHDPQTAEARPWAEFKVKGLLDVCVSSSSA